MTETKFHDDGLRRFPKGPGQRGDHLRSIGGLNEIKDVAIDELFRRIAHRCDARRTLKANDTVSTDIRDLVLRIFNERSKMRFAVAQGVCYLLALSNVHH